MEQTNVNVNQLDALIKGGMNAGEMTLIAGTSKPGKTDFMLMQQLNRIPVWVENGNYYGYPACCIKEFCLDTNDISGRNIVLNGKKNRSGFIPCFNHRQQILLGETTLSEIIDKGKREAPEPFQEVWE